MATTTKTPTAKKSAKSEGATKSAAASKTGTTAKPATRSTSTRATKSDATNVKAKSDAAKDLADLFEDGLKDIYWAEKELLKALPKMQKNASTADLQQAIEKHITETKTHVKRLEECFKSIGKKAQAEKCEAMEGLIEEGNSIMEETEKGYIRDAGIIAAAQKVEHYEIATYGTLAAFAKVLKDKTSLSLLLQTLEEEKNCDETLSEIADTNLNTKAK